MGRFITLFLLLAVMTGRAMSAEPFYSFKLGREKISWLKKDVKTESKNGKTDTTITYQNNDGTLLLSETKTCYRDYPVVEWIFSLINTGRTDSPVLTDVLAADCHFSIGERPVLWHGIGESENPQENYSFRRDALTKTVSFSPQQGYSSYHAFPYFRLIGSERTLTIAIGWCGSWQACFAPQKDGKIHFTAGQKGVKTYLKPGETFVSPRITVLSAENEDAGAQLWRAWFREYILPRENGQPLQPKFVGDGSSGRGDLYTQTAIGDFLDSLSILRKAGFKLDAWWIDAGWYPISGIDWFSSAGNWVPDPARMPNGLKPLADELRKTDTDLVLWYEPERVHEKSGKFADFKPYFSPYRANGSGRYDLSRPEVLKHVETMMTASLKENGVAILRQDSNGEGPENFWKACDRQQGKNRCGSTENFYIQNMYKFWDCVRANAGIKFIDNCASGGRRNDLETLRHHAVPLHYSDTGYFEFIQKQRYTYMLAQWFLYYKNIIGHDCVNGKPDFYRIVIDLAPFSTLFAESGRPMPYLEENKRYARLFEAARPYLINASYHLLTPEVFSESTWTVCQYHDARTGSGLIRAIRNSKAVDAAYTVKPVGLDSAKHYVFTDLLGRIPEFELDGQTLLTKGFVLPLAPQDATILRYAIKK